MANTTARLKVEDAKVYVQRRPSAVEAKKIEFSAANLDEVVKLARKHKVALKDVHISYLECGSHKVTVWWEKPVEKS